jgi:SAM-dependent methyltransferase
MELPNTYGDAWADIYDEWASYQALDPTSSVQFLNSTVKAGSFLELGIGTGRIALPLALLGREVHGLEASEKMISAFLDKPGSESIVVRRGDYSNFQMPEKYAAIYAAFNGLWLLPTAEDQINCFKCVAETLRPDGLFIVECEVPDLTNFVNNIRFRVEDATSNRLHVQISVHSPGQQQIFFYHFRLHEGSINMRPVTVRYLGHSELDLMANLAGLTLRSRFSNWNAEKFTSRSKGHVSVYEKKARNELE